MVGIHYLTNNSLIMISKIYSVVVYLSLILTILYHSFEIHLSMLYGLCNLASLFDDPTRLDMDFYMELAKFSWILNFLIVLPIGLILTIVNIVRKSVHRDTVLLFLLNFIFIYLNYFYMHIGISNWIFD